MASQIPFHVTTQLHEAEFKGGLSLHSPHCIAYKLPKDHVQSVLENISKKVPTEHEAKIYTASVDWIESLTNSISQELSKNYQTHPDDFIKTGRSVANIVSSVGNGIWSSGITPINAIRDIETNIPLYISDYFDQLSGWSREHVFDDVDSKIGCNLTGLRVSDKPYPAESPYGPEPALSKIFVRLGWTLPVVKVNLSFKTDSNTPSFGKGEASYGDVYRYYSFLDAHKQAIAIDDDGSIVRKIYNFTDPSQLWRVESFGKFYALYNKKYKTYLGRNLRANDSKPDNSWHNSAVYLVEDPDTSVYSIRYTENNRDYPTILDNLTLVTVPLVAWRNTSGHFLNLNDAQNGTLNYSNGEKYGNNVIPTPEQLFLFVPHPDFAKKAVVIGHNGKFLEIHPISNKATFSYDLKTPVKLPFALFDYEQNIYPWSANYLASRLQQPLIVGAAATAAIPPPGKGTRVRVWKADPSVQKIGIRELFLVHTDIATGPKDDILETSSTTAPIVPDANGDFLLDFDNTPSEVPETDNHTRFDVIHTYSCVRYTYDLLSGDLEYLDGNPPVLNRPWGNKRLVIHPHAGEDANAYYSREEGVLKFFYTKQPDSPIIYLCRSIDVVAHETGHSFLDILQPGWLTDGQTGGFHEAFGDLCSLFVLISMAEIADLFVTLTKANLRDPSNFLSAIGEEFGDALYHNKGKGLRNLSNDLKGSKAGSEVHAVSMVFSGFYYDVLVDVFALERNPAIKSDTETLMDVGACLRRALIIAIRVSSARPTRTKFQEIATNLETAFGTLGRRLGVDLTSWAQIVRKHAKDRELSLAGLSK